MLNNAKYIPRFPGDTDPSFDLVNDFSPGRLISGGDGQFLLSVSSAARDANQGTKEGGTTVSPTSPNSFATSDHGTNGLINAEFSPSVSSDAGSAPQGSSGGTGSGGTTVSPTSSSTASPFVINITWDSSVGSAPPGFMTGVQAAVQYLESQYTDAVTVNIHVGYGEVGGTALGPGALGESQSYLSSVSYSSLLNALKADAKTATDTSAVASLPAGSPISGTFWTTTAEAKALGLRSATNTSTDGNVGFSATTSFTYNESNGVAAGTYDFNAVVLHEVSEVMGRMLLTGATIGSTTNSYDTLDLFHYSSANVRDFSASATGYFSIDGGTTNLHGFNTQSGGDAGDWASTLTPDAFDAFATSGVVEAVSNADLTTLDAIGWDRTSSGGTPSAPTGVAISAVTASLAQALTTGGLSANSALASVIQVGGASGDSYSYALGSNLSGGTDANSFILSSSVFSSGNPATLSAGAAGVPGAFNGKLYALTVTATDTTSGNSSPAVAVDVVVGGVSTSGSDGDIISLSALTGTLGGSTPTFIYGLAGADKIDGTGMTGKLWFDGGAGADTMTGGSGVNDYLYGATGDSTGSAMDIVTNFHAAMDLIDLTGLGIALQVSGKINGNAGIAAHSAGWQTNGGNTFVYVNTSGAKETLAGTDMKIELQGGVTLSSGNILHV